MPSADERVRWQRRFASDANNRAWALAEQATLTPDEQAELLTAAHASAYHWSQIGSHIEKAQAALLLGQVHARLGHGELAMCFASAAYDVLTAPGAEPWQTVFAHAILAHAAAVCGQTERHARHYSEARTLADRLSDPEDRQIFMATFDRIPAPG